MFYVFICFERRGICFRGLYCHAKTPMSKCCEKEQQGSQSPFNSAALRYFFGQTEYAVAMAEIADATAAIAATITDHSIYCALLVAAKAAAFCASVASIEDIS
jgi:hypothetical protein